MNSVNPSLMILTAHSSITSQSACSTCVTVSSMEIWIPSAGFAQAAYKCGRHVAVVLRYTLCTLHYKLHYIPSYILTANLKKAVLLL